MVWKGGRGLQPGPAGTGSRSLGVWRTREWAARAYLLPQCGHRGVGPGRQRRQFQTVQLSLPNSGYPPLLSGEYLAGTVGRDSSGSLYTGPHWGFKTPANLLGEG